MKTSMLYNLYLHFKIKWKLSDYQYLKKHRQKKFRQASSEVLDVDKLRDRRLLEGLDLFEFPMMLS